MSTRAAGRRTRTVQRFAKMSLRPCTAQRTTRHRQRRRGSLGSAPPSDSALGGGDRGLGHGRRREDEGQHDEAARRQSRPVATRRPVSCAKASKRLAARRVCGRATGMVAGLGHPGTQV